MKHPGRVSLFCIFVFLCVASKSAYSTTRWSSLHSIPDADLLQGGQIILNAESYFFSDVDSGMVIKPAGGVTLGLIEWVNLEAGYAGGFSLGFKARILGETKSWMPSLAVGARNVFSNKESYFSDRAPDSLNNEFYFAFAKSIEPVRLRLHFGMQSIPSIETERYNPFFGLEKYFGAGLYVSAEVNRRDSRFHPSIFVSWRALKQKLEISTGVVDITGMFSEDKSSKGFSLASSIDDGYVRPGIWAGLRFQIGLKQKGGFSSIEDRISMQEKTIASMQLEIDTLKMALTGNISQMRTINSSLEKLADTTGGEQKQLSLMVIGKLNNLKNLYSQEPFEPEQVKKNLTELVSFRDRILPVLSEIVLDKNQQKQIRTLAVMVIGEIGLKSASDILIEILSRSFDPEMKIEALIALGKLKETRAVFLMQQLENDPNDGVSFTASEVLQKLQKETGIILTKGDTATLPSSIPETKIGGRYQPIAGVQIKPEKKSDTAVLITAPVVVPLAFPKTDSLSSKAISASDPAKDTTASRTYVSDSSTTVKGTTKPVHDQKSMMSGQTKPADSKSIAKNKVNKTTKEKADASEEKKW
jgi:hypothetical protein